MRKTLLFALFVVGLGAIAFAQDAPPPIPVPPDWNAELVAAIVALTPIVVRLIVIIGTFIVPAIPRIAVPFVAFALTSLAAYLTGLTSENPVIGALLGLAAIGLRELVKLFVFNPFGLGNKLTRSEGNYIVKV